MKLSCDNVRDILPLYVDNVVSEDTRKLVEEHLAGCRTCMQEAESMERSIAVPTDGDGKKIKKFKRKRKIKVILTVCISIVAVAAIVLGVFYRLLYVGHPLSSEDVEITEMFGYQEPDYIYLHQDWLLRIENKNNKPLQILYEPIMVTDENGVWKTIGAVYYINEVSVKGVFQNNHFTISASYSLIANEGKAPSDDYDYTVKVVYSDKTVVYSMRDEGLYEQQSDLVYNYIF